MGYNTTVVVYNDALGDIENDPEFGKNLAIAVREAWNLGRNLRGNGYHDTVNIRAGNHANAAVVVETHHADEMVVVAVGGNMGQRVMSLYGKWALRGKGLRDEILAALMSSKAPPVVHVICDRCRHLRDSHIEHMDTTPTKGCTVEDCTCSAYVEVADGETKSRAGSR